MEIKDFNRPPGMKPYTKEALEAGAKYYNTLVPSDFWTDEEAEEYLQVLIDRECKPRFRSIDDPWEPS